MNLAINKFTKGRRMQQKLNMRLRYILKNRRAGATDYQSLQFSVIGGTQEGRSGRIQEISSGSKLQEVERRHRSRHLPPTQHHRYIR
jgi:hypothetical protein